MARGGSFGGGNRGGGFSGGGRSGSFSSSGSKSGGFSSGSRSSGGFSSGNFSSYKKSGGATRASNPTPVHTNKSSFFTGAVLGSILSSNKNRSSVYYGNMSKNDVFPEVAGSNYTPKRPDPNRGREYMLCEYCGSEYNDLNVTKCQNCGAKTTRKREEIKKAGQVLQPTDISSGEGAGKQKSSKKKALTVFIVIAAIVLFIFVLAVIFGGQEEFTPITYDWEGGNAVEYDQEVSFNNWAEGSALSLKVDFAQVTGDLSGYGYDQSDYYYCVAAVEIKNTSSSDYILYISDLTLKADGDLYVASSLGGEGQKVFSERSEEGYMVIEGGEYVYATLIYPIYNYQSLSALSLEYREFTSGGSQLGAYLLYLD